MAVSFPQTLEARADDGCYKWRERARLVKLVNNHIAIYAIEE